MNNFVIRTEELEDSQLKELYVETENDNDILNRLKSQSPVLLVAINEQIQNIAQKKDTLCRRMYN